MKPQKIIAYIKSSRDRGNLQAIINAAEARDSILSNIEGKRTRAAMWEKVMKLGLKKGDMVFIHTGPNVSLKDTKGMFSSKKHQNLWGRPLTIKSIKPRKKEIEVKIMGLGECKLSPFECASLKLSTTPTAEALAHSLQKTHSRVVGRGEDKTGSYFIEKSIGPNGDIIITRTNTVFNQRKK